MRQQHLRWHRQRRLQQQAAEDAAAAEFAAMLEQVADEPALAQWPQEDAFSGAIDEGALFYLRARGVPREVATDLLVLAFIDEAIQEIEHEGLADDIRARLQQWLERRRQG